LDKLEILAQLAVEDLLGLLVLKDKKETQVDQLVLMVQLDQQVRVLLKV
jgi:hypothetical protein